MSLPMPPIGTEIFQKHYRRSVSQQAQFEQHYMNCDVCCFEAKEKDKIEDFDPAKLCRKGRKILAKIK